MRRDRRSSGGGTKGAQHDGLEATVDRRDQTHLVHRVEHGVIRDANGLLTLGGEETPSRESRDHLVDVRTVTTLYRANQHLGPYESVRREQVRLLLVLLFHRLDEVLIGLVRRTVRYVQRQVVE